MVKQAVPLQPMEVHGGTGIKTEACGGSRTGVGGSDLTLQLAECHGGVDSWQELGPMDRCPYRIRFSGMTSDPLGAVHSGRAVSHHSASLAARGKSEGKTEDEPGKKNRVGIPPVEGKGRRERERGFGSC
ncbi:hypothetical protein BTVI_54106 [Pitangus sulphuratus]|nr:hypothetical protein BTVI_54106 [Pitangus sulphuratus]